MTEAGRSIDRLRDRAPPGLAPLVLAGVAAVAVALVHATVFEHLSVNHDEGVYLQQAAMLLEGRLVMSAGDLAGAVRPWFFVRDGGILYPKYTPVTAAVFAGGKLLAGSYAAALPAVAFAVVLLAVHLTTAAFDRRTGLLAGAFVVASPLFLVTTATFLSYAPATALNLLFALAYVRSIRRGSRRWAVLAGFAVGLAFFARPYTAVLFAAPFVGHAALTIGSAWRAGDRGPLVVALARNGTVATLGLAGVALALAYNWRLTGSPLLFPYEAFAPRDGPGFGRRAILSHELEYTVGLGLRANALVLWSLLTDWFAAPPVGALLAIGGAGAFLARVRRRWTSRPWGLSRIPTDRLSGDALRALLLGVAATVVVGNVAFWGNLNVLGNPSVRGDGLIAALGPFYHFDLLVPLSAFAAHGALLGWDRLRAGVGTWADRRFELDPVGRMAAVSVATLLVVAPLLASGAVAVAEPLAHNAGHQERFDRAYEPFDERTFDRALVFVPTPYGEWLNHPFQRLRNDPGLDGPVVYALDRGPAEDVRVLDAFDERRPYRFAYRGEWSGDPDARVTPKLERLQVVEGERVRITSTFGVPDGARVSSVRLEAADEVATARPAVAGDQRAAGGDQASADGNRTSADGAQGSTDADEFAVEWVVDRDRAGTVAGTASGNGTVPVDGATAISLAVTVVQPGGASLTYRQDLTVEPTGAGVRVVWPPETRVCRLTTDCGTEGTYLPDRPDAHVDGVDLDARATATGGANESVGGEG